MVHKGRKSNSAKKILGPQSNEERLRRMATVIQDSNDAITIQDLEGRILAWNRGAEIIYGYSEGEALRMNIVDTVPESHRSEALNFIAALKLGEVVPVLETKRRAKNGRIIDVWLTNTKLVDDKGKLTGVATTGRDITERKIAEAAMRDKARELEFLREGQITLSDKMRGEQDVSRLGQSVLSHLAPFLNAQMGAFYCLTDQNTLRRVSGYAYAKLDAKERTIALGEGLIGQAALEKRPILLENLPPSYFGVIQSDLGESAPRSLLLAPVFYDGKVNGIIELASFNSFSEHQRTFLAHVSENIGIAINTSISRKNQQELLERSQILTERLQSQQDELKATNEELEEQSRALQMSQARLQTQQTELEETNAQLEEQTLALEMQRDTLNQKNDALNKAQKLLEERSEEIQRASQYKSEFLANMSHELRTPLNSSLILAKLLSENAVGNLSAEQIQYANSIYSAGNDLLNLINDILDLSKVEAGKLEVRLENVFLPSVVGSLNKTFGPVAKEKGVTFEVRLAAGVPDRIFTDQQRLEQILKNLLSNAFKFTQKGEVLLEISLQADHRVAFMVSDTGIGVDPAHQEIIFEAFRQADGTTNRKYGGTGLGLSISRDLARLLGGVIEVRSELGQGSQFTLRLPKTYDESRIEVAAPKKYSPSAAKAVPEPTGLALERPRTTARPKATPFADDRDLPAASRKTVLVIEDDVRFAHILFELAHELKYRCLVAQDAEEGLSLAETHYPDAILLDMKLPDRSGLLVLDRLKENPKTRHIPVHVASAHDYSEKALQMGAIGYILKPAKREALKSAFEKIEFHLARRMKRVLLVEDDRRQRESIVELLSDSDVEITAVELASEALDALKSGLFDCIIIDLKLPDMSGEQLLKEMNAQEMPEAFPPVIVYTGRSLSIEEEDRLRKYSRAIIIKGARSPDRLVEEVSLFLHHIDTDANRKSSSPPAPAKNRDDIFQGRRILVVDDDVRNIFALTSALEQKGAAVEVAKSGRDALVKLAETARIDLVLMDIMMPEMDGFEATREIRKQKRFARLPIIAVTAKASKQDQVHCMEAGADDYLAKPIDLSQLFSLIRVWLPELGRDDSRSSFDPISKELL
jgi:PAS domain S-box-containing protein